MKSFTFDTNCIIDVDCERASAGCILEIVEAHRSHIVDAAFIAVSASERQKGDCFLPAYLDFMDRLKRIGLEDIPQIQGTGYYGLSYWDHALYADAEAQEREREIHNVLFPNIEFAIGDFAKSKGLENVDVSSPELFKWRNAWCDRQMIWSHDHFARDVCVSSDRNFKKLNRSANFEDVIVCNPKEAAEMVA